MTKAKKNHHFLQCKIALLFVFYYANFSTAQINTDWNKENLKGKVKSLTEHTYEAKMRFGITKKGISTNQFFLGSNDFQIIFNIQGKLIGQNEYKLDGSLFSKFTYKYDDYNKIIEEREQRFYDDSIVFKISSIYDEFGNNIEKNYYKSDGILIRKHTYKYDLDGNRIESKSFKQNENLYSTITYKYDEEGNEIETNYITIYGVLDGKYIFKYDTLGYVIESKHFQPDGNLKYSSVYRHDKFGNEIESIDYDSEGKLKNKFTVKYKYDKMGNWIKAIKSEDGIAKFILERQIEYYEVEK